MCREKEIKGEEGFFNFFKSKKEETRIMEKIGVLKRSTKLEGRYKWKCITNLKNKLMC